MGTWNTRGLRGSTLEDLVNRTNEQYQENGMAVIHKIPTPITPVKNYQAHPHFTMANFEIFWERREQGGRKSFKLVELSPEFYL